MANNQAQSLFSKLKLNVHEKEILCNLDLQREEQAQVAQEAQRILAVELAKFYAVGSDTVAPDAWKVKEFNNIASAASASKEQSKTTTFKEDLRNFIANLWRMDTFYKFLAWWYNGIRLLLVRLNRILLAFGRTLLPPWFKYLSLANGAGVIADVTILIKATLDTSLSSKEDLKKYSRIRCAWRRFVRHLNKDGRVLRMINDVLWFTINLTVIVISGPILLILNPLLNMVGFAADLAVEMYRLYLAKYVLYNNLLAELDTEIKVLDDDVKAAQKGSSVARKVGRRKAALEYVRSRVKAKQSGEINKQWYMSGATAALFVGMAAIYFVPAAFFLGSLLAFIGGSILIGISRRVYITVQDHGPKFWQYIKSKLNPKTPVVPAKPTIAPKPVVVPKPAVIPVAAVVLEPDVALVPVSMPIITPAPTLPHSSIPCQQAEKAVATNSVLISTNMFAPQAKPTSSLVNRSTSPDNRFRSSSFPPGIFADESRTSSPISPPTSAGSSPGSSISRTNSRLDKNIITSHTSVSNLKEENKSSTANRNNRARSLSFP